VLKAVYGREVIPGDRVTVREGDPVITVKRVTDVSTDPPSVSLTDDDGHNTVIYAGTPVILHSRKPTKDTTKASLYRQLHELCAALGDPRREYVALVEEGNRVLAELLRRLRETLDEFELTG